MRQPQKGGSETTRISWFGPFAVDASLLKSLIHERSHLGPSTSTTSVGVDVATKGHKGDVKVNESERGGGRKKGLDRAGQDRQGSGRRQTRNFFVQQNLSLTGIWHIIPLSFTFFHLK